MDPDTRSNRDPREARDVLPSLSDRSDAAAASRVSRALDVFTSAQKLPAYSIHDQQRLLHDRERQQPPSSQRLSYPASVIAPVPTSVPTPAPTSFETSSRHYFQQPQPQQQQQPPPLQLPYSHPTNGSDSQETTSSADTSASTDTDQLFTPPISDGELSVRGGGSGSVNSSVHPHNYELDPPSQESHQESQLLQLSRLAATRERIGDMNTTDAYDGALSRKRAADGSVKHTRNASSTSPVFYGGGHSRNTSTVSVASTVGSRIGELSAELKTRLSYAMVKVNNGWQAHSIDQVETLASQAASPMSSTSTIHGRHSPRLPPSLSHRRYQSHASQASVSTVSTTIAPAARALSVIDAATPSSSQQSSHSTHSTPPLPSPLGMPQTGPAAPVKSLAPPASIQPAQPGGARARRNSNPAFVPPALASLHNTPYDTAQRTPGADPILFSPHQNVREQDAIETLLFMSSPGNSSSMARFPSVSASQPLPSSHHAHHQQSPSQELASPQRHALPGAPRKSLPSARPNVLSHGSQPLPDRRSGHRPSPSDMDLDEPYGSPYSRSVKGTPKRRGNVPHGSGADLSSPRLKVPLSIPSGLSISKPRPVLGEDDIERMLDRAAAASADDSSDSDGEILIPVRRTNHVGI